MGQTHQPERIGETDTDHCSNGNRAGRLARTGAAEYSPNFIKLLLVLPADRLTLAVDLCVWRDDAVRLRLCLHHLELHTAHATPHQEHIVLCAMIEESAGPCYNTASM